MSFSNYLEAKLLDHAFGGTSFTQPSALYVKLHVGDPGEDCTANAAGNTVRQAVTFAAASSPAGTKASNAQVQWTNVSTAETYSHFSVWDASSSGNPLGSGALTTPTAVTVGATVTMASGALVITLD